jgi:hypothetical protein
MNKTVMINFVDYLILGGTTFIQIMALVLLIIFFRMIRNYHHSFMEIFITLPRKCLLNLNTKAESFVADFQVNL